MAYCRILWILLAILFITHSASAQKNNNKDTVDIIPIDTTNSIIDAVKDTKITKEILKTVTRKPKEEENILNIRSEEAFMPFDGKIIRQILINHIDFERSITDSSTNIKSRLVRLGNTLHNTS